MAIDELLRNELKEQKKKMGVCFEAEKTRQTVEEEKPGDLGE